MDRQLDVRGYPGPHDHLAALEAADLAWRIDEPANKDPEIHILSRRMFCGRFPAAERGAFFLIHAADGKAWRARRRQGFRVKPETSAGNIRNIGKT